MPNWYDYFDRADGSLGSDWYDRSGTWTISSGHAVGGTNALEYRNVTGETGDQDVSAGLVTPTGQYVGVGLVLKAGGNTAYFYEIAFVAESGGITCNIVEYGYPYQTTHATGYYTGDMTELTTVRASYVAGVVTGYVNGQQIAQWADSRYGSQGQWGLMQVAGSTSLDWVMYGPPVVRSLEVTPDPLWVGGGQQLLTLTGTNTEWTPGEPGSTTITADHGTVDLQRVVSATVAEAWYTPAEYIGTITFTESEYGLTDTINGVAVMPEGYGETECRLTPQGAALINDTAVDTPLTYKLWRRDTPVGTTPIDYTLAETYKSLADYLINNGWLGNQKPAVDLSIVMRALNGGYEPAAGPYPEPTYRVLTDFLAALSTQIGDVQGPGGITLAVLAAALSDLRGVGSPSIKDVLDAVGNVNNDDVMTYLQALRGNDVVNLLQVVTALTNIQTLNGYDLGTIVQRLDDRPTTLNMNAAFAITNGAIGGLALEIAGLYKALGVVEATNIFDVISGILGDLFSGLGQEVVDQFLDSIFGPDTPLPQIVLVPPIWPGLSRANVGNAVALQNGQTIAGPLHGLLFTIDQQPTEKYAYHFGNVRSWGRVGAVIFATDRGDYERSQTFALDTQVLCPQQMAVADHAIIKVNSGWGGTVRPWTITQPQSP